MIKKSRARAWSAPILIVLIVGCASESDEPDELTMGPTAIGTPAAGSEAAGSGPTVGATLAGMGAGAVTATASTASDTPPPMGGSGGSMGNVGGSTSIPAAGGSAGTGTESAAGSGGTTAGAASGMGGSPGSAGNAGIAEGGAGGDRAQAGVGGAAAGGDGQGGGGFDAGDFFGVEEGDTIPHRQMQFTFDGGRDIAQFKPSDANPAAAEGPAGTDRVQRAGVNTCANRMLGKLLVNLDWEGGDYWDWAAQRGFHSFGVAFYHCGSIDRFWEKRDRDYPGDCRLETFDGQDHDSEMAIDLAHSITGHLQDGLRYLHERNPSQDWDYFLNEDGSVRWSDVAFTGESHGAQSVIRFAKAVRVYRSVGRSGPRDNGCGTGSSSSPFDPNNPPWDENCPIERISSWLDEESATPTERMFGLTGAQDNQYGDIMFSMERMNLPGEFVNLDTTGPPFTGNRFYAVNYDHGTFHEDRFNDVLNYAFGVPEENWNGCD